MPCPVCDHTMQNLGLDQGGRRTFWCPRCGTLKTDEGPDSPGGFETQHAPRWALAVLSRDGGPLAERLRRLGARVGAD